MSTSTSTTDEYNRLSPLHRAAHDLTHTALPMAFYLLFVIAGTIILIYTLCLERIIPKGLIVGISITFTILIISICIGRILLYLAWNTFAEGFGPNDISTNNTSDKAAKKSGRRSVDISRERKRDRRRILHVLVNHLRCYGENYYNRLVLPIREDPTARRQPDSTIYDSSQPQLSNEELQLQYANIVDAVMKQDRESAISRQVRALNPNPSATMLVRTPKLLEVHTSMTETKDGVSVWRNTLQENCGLSSEFPIPQGIFSQDTDITATPSIARQVVEFPSSLMNDEVLLRGEVKRGHQPQPRKESLVSTTNHQDMTNSKTNQHRHLHGEVLELREEQELSRSAEHRWGFQASKLMSYVRDNATLERLSIIVPDPLSSAEDKPRMRKRHLMYLRMPETTQEEVEYMRHQIICLGQRVAQLLPPEHWGDKDREDGPNDEFENALERKEVV